jgi:hypothetical protein
MADYELVNKELHTNIHFKTPSQFSFAKHESMLPIGHSELTVLAKDLPVVFLKNTDGKFHLTLLLSLIPGDNELIDENGLWKLPYVPAVLRCHPFKLLSLQNNEAGVSPQKVLAFIKDTPFIKFENKDGTSPLFDTEGNLTDRAQHLNKLLYSLDQETSASSTKLQKLFELGLLAELSTIDKENKKTVLRNVFSVDTNKLAECSKKDLKELISNSTMDLIYYQKFSLVNFKNILKNRHTTDISTRDTVLRESKERKASEINSLVQTLLVDE